MSYEFGFSHDYDGANGVGTLECLWKKGERFQRTRPEEAKWKRYRKFYVTALEVFFRDVRPTRFESRDCPTLRDPTHERTLTKVRGGSCHRRWALTNAPTVVQVPLQSSHARQRLAR